MKTHLANRSTAHKYALAGQPFKASALSGTPDPMRFNHSHDYSERDAATRYDKARRADLVSYVVHSYAAPIVWRDVWGDWHSIDVRYSVTTSKHQGKMRADLVRQLTDDADTFWRLFDDAGAPTQADALALRQAATLLVRG
jgi:hypothetical protein